ncbi:hypothetical protein JCM30471_20590 [Desulfuromonas carbonis]|uniref:DUF1127 domain-containing protein n=1 Tax=Desulfuromonas sp. DDH964 TaxID=1823759 RepID=UPI00078C44C6|nr:DUF1127 domain-containing protein [Desulfuromonas sp. DDH964]AMV73641.1 hypothetical protein DBW_3342 [Desulfuromonas sp. DDH964]
MKTLSLERIATRRSETGWGGALLLAGRALLEALKRRRNWARGLSQLQEMDDRMLADLGISRADVDQMARKGPGWVPERRGGGFSGTA